MNAVRGPTEDANRSLLDIFTDLTPQRVSESGIVGVFYCDAKGRIVDATDKFLSMLGYTRDDVTSGRLDVGRITPPRWTALDTLKMAEVASTGSASAWEKEFYACDGRIVPVMVAMARLDAAGNQCAVICLDLTNRREAELDRERRLGREHAERERAEQAIRMRDEVLAVVAHDLRNPLNTIQMSVSALADKTLAPEIRERQIAVVERVVADMNQLIGNLLDVARMQTGSFPITKVPVNMRALLERTISAFELQLQERQVVLEQELSDPGPVACDEAQLMRVLGNLISNALKFTPRNGRIRLRCHRKSESLQISVEDTGPGISEQDMPHVFDRFWKADHAGKLGVGLGLAIAKGVIESHGGRIWVESRLGHGSAFHFTIPI